MCIVVICGKDVNAQSYYIEDNRTFYGGASIGTTFSQIDGDAFAGYHRIGLTGGAIVYAELAKKFAISLELLYAQKGLKSHKEQPGPGFRLYDYDIKLNYAEVPVIFNYFDKRKSHFGLGAAYAQLISSKETVLTDSADINAVNFDDYPFRKYDIMAVASANLHLGKGFFLNIRYQYSLISIRNDFYKPISRRDATGQYNNSWVLKLMYLFE